MISPRLFPANAACSSQMVSDGRLGALGLLELPEEDIVWVDWQAEWRGHNCGTVITFGWSYEGGRASGCQF